jgi:hypothetical protein
MSSISYAIPLSCQLPDLRQDPEELEAEYIAHQVVPGFGVDKIEQAPLDLHYAPSRQRGLPLSEHVRSFMESQFTYDFSRVRIHTNRTAASLARLLGACAFTYGNHIFFGEGQYTPGTKSGMLLLAHELAHVVQQACGGVKRIQRFEAAVHECIEYYALTRGDKALSRDEARAVYFGNWMRDFNQVLIPMVLSLANTSALVSPLVTYDNLFLLINSLAYVKFRQYLTPEQFGYYIPTEHIDNPAGLVKEFDLLPEQPTPSNPSLTPRSASAYQPRPAQLETRQEQVSPFSVVSDGFPRIPSNIFTYDQAAVMAFLARSSVHVEKRLELAVTRGRNPDGMMHCGAALHAVEDLFSHTNWIEIAVGKILMEEPTLLPDLAEAERKLFTYSPQAQVAGQPRSVLTSGSFISADTVISLHSELINLLAEGPAPFRTDEEIEADRRLTEGMLRDFSEKFRNDRAFRGAVNDTEIGSWIPNLILANLHTLYITINLLPEWVRRMVHEATEPIKAALMQQFAAWILAYGVRTSVADTTLIKALRDSDRLVKGEVSQSEWQEIVSEARFLGRRVRDLEREKLAKARARLRNLQATPDKVVAGPSHSQLSKDHINNVFFGLSFFMATVAIERLMNKLMAAWEEQSPVNATSYRFSGKLTAKPLQEAAAKAISRAQRIIRQGGDIPKSFYDLNRYRKAATDSIRNTANMLDSVASSRVRQADRMEILRSHLTDVLEAKFGPEMPSGLSRYLLQSSDEGLRLSAQFLRMEGEELPVEKVLRDSARELRITADLIEQATSQVEREKANRLLVKRRDDCLSRALRTPSPDFAFYSGVLLIIDLHIVSTAVAYTSEQREILEGKKVLTGVIRALEAGNVTLPPLPPQDTAFRELIEEARLILSHPYQNPWWTEALRSFIARNPEQMTWEIRARNEGHPLFKMPTKAEYEAWEQKHTTDQEM